MSKNSSVCLSVILLLYCFDVCLFSVAKKSWSYRGLKKLSKSEVDIRTYLFPCSLDDSRLNSTFDNKHKHLCNCKKKLVIKMLVQSGKECNSKSDGFIPIDHVIDGITGRKKRLLNPLMIRIKRERMYQLYDLELMKTVNAEAKEEVINYENTANFSGCDTSSSRPTCGFSFINNKIIQFSEGFCCSCDQAKNDERQPCEGHSADGKKNLNLPEQVVRHYRSNRSSRDIELLESDISTKNSRALNNKKNEIGKHNVGKVSYDNKSVNEKKSKNPDYLVLQQNSNTNSFSSDHMNNITIKGFKFEWTHAPKPLKTESDHTISSFKVILDNLKKGETRGEQSDSELKNNSISGDTFKIFMINKIKQNKNKEKVISMTESPRSYAQSTLTQSFAYVTKGIDQLGGEDSELQIKSVASNTLVDNSNFEQHLEDSNNGLENRQLSSELYPNNIKFNPAKSNDIFKQIGYHTAANEFGKSLLFKESPTKLFKSNEENNTKIDAINKFISPITTEYSVLHNIRPTDSLIGLNKEYITQNETPILKLKENMISSVNLSDPFHSNQQLSKTINFSLNAMSDSQHGMIIKREMCDRQIRGGQSCSEENKDIPCKANKETYFESAHCLRYSDLWYNVHKLFNPRMENSITVKIYNKHKTPVKKVCWENLTKRLHGRIGTMNEALTDDLETILITYSSNDKVAFNLDCAADYLLVPQPVHKRCKNAELKELYAGGPGEFLVLKENDITFDGEECDKAGVTYSAFARQAHRCQHEAGSCLKNQPLQFWRDDKKATAKGKPGQYFLSNFITLTDQSILQNTSNNQVVLRAPYLERFQSNVVVELNADHLDIIADKSEAQITEVYIDATTEKSALIKIVVTNMGIASDLFGIDFVNCTSPLGPCDFDKPGRDELPPQHRITYTANIYSTVLHKHTECNAVVLNIDQEIVAVRRIVIIRGQRCMCVWHCQCVCHNYPEPGLLCTPLTLQDYNLAGFPGQLPAKTWSSCSMLFLVIQGLLWLFLFLLIFGCIKAVLGLCFAYVAVWGLWYVLPDEALNLYCYMESHLACYPLVRDCNGFPIHPKTFNRIIHFLPWYSEFLVNIFFFVCALRCCLCDRLSRSASNIMYPNQYQPMCGEMGNPCSPGAKSPFCGSTCSKVRKFRLSAGGGSKQAIEARKKRFLDQLEEKKAEQYTHELSKSYVVFRNLSRPLGGVLLNPGVRYCIRGFFLESENGVYQFNPPSPLMQIWRMDGSPLEPPLILDQTPFRKTYYSKRELMTAQDLSTEAQHIVINAP